jgi:caffeoyl-CoA O-methyltransferase
VTIRIGPALESLRELEPGVDFAYVDADKPGYPAYYEALVELLRPGGVMVLDNMLRGGRVLDPQDDGSRAVDELNRRIAADARVESVLLALHDGVTVARRR